MLATVRDAAIFLGTAILLMPLVSATLCSVALAWSYDNPPFAAWPRVFLGDVTGAAIAGPFALLILSAAAKVPQFTRADQIEAALLTAFFLFLAVLSLGSFFPFVFIMLFPILWAALRFRMMGANIAVLVLALSSSFLTAADISPFGESGIYGRYGYQGLQIFLLAITVTALMIGAIAIGNRRRVPKRNIAPHQCTRPNPRRDRIIKPGGRQLLCTSPVIDTYCTQIVNNRSNIGL
ncbi:MAG: hypothetical protein HC788_03400 [Sphingopyxis sp.]|nr:hypothetical protein [Sphingopyxis sp.]